MRFFAQFINTVLASLAFQEVRNLFPEKNWPTDYSATISFPQRGEPEESLPFFGGSSFLKLSRYTCTRNEPSWVQVYSQLYLLTESWRNDELWLEKKGLWRFSIHYLVRHVNGEFFPIPHFYTPITTLFLREPKKMHLLPQNNAVIFPWWR